MLFPMSCKQTFSSEYSFSNGQIMMKDRGEQLERRLPRCAPQRRGCEGEAGARTTRGNGESKLLGRLQPLKSPYHAKAPNSAAVDFDHSRPDRNAAESFSALCHRKKLVEVRSTLPPFHKKSIPPIMKLQPHGQMFQQPELPREGPPATPGQARPGHEDEKFMLSS
ncbi:hypothetical protein BDZ45DRAFT_685309 [Acephala macrosclerotiorum]|nr:hypothetical protein BDZ45DRAFT_685309 [Acephala macrosclerotiorum]